MSSASAADEESDQWLDIKNISVPFQTLDEILAERVEFLDEELSGFDEDESISWSREPCSSASSFTYELSPPILLEKLGSFKCHQVLSARGHQIGGAPSAIAVSEIFFAVGTCRGLVLIFERKSGKLTQYINPEKDCGAVAALDFSADSTKLAIGLSRGTLLCASCGTTNKSPRKFEEIVQAGHGILHVKYATDSSLLVVDNGGSVHQVRERARFSRNYRCIFAGSKGEVVNICIIRPVGLVILVSLTQVIILSLKNERHIGQLRLTSSVMMPPLVDYCHRSFKINSRTGVEDTRICLARDGHIRIYEVKIGEVLSLSILKTIHISESLINLKWIDDHHLMAMTQLEQFLLIDIQKGAVLAKHNFSHVNLVYNTSDFKGLATGGNVSEALISLSEFVCYQSVVCYGENISQASVYILGENGVFTVSIIDQIVQLEMFVAKDEIVSALSYISDIYCGLVQDKTPNGNLRNHASLYVVDLIFRQLKSIVFYQPTKLSDLTEHYKRNILVLLRVCISCSHFNLLYNEIYQQLAQNEFSKSAFLELLDEFVCEGQLHQPSPTLVNDYLAHLANEGHYSQYESAVTKFPVDIIDFHKVIITCRENQLFDGIVHLLNNTLDDYLGPLKEMFESLKKFVNKEVFSDLEIDQGNKLLLYINCCLSGRTYSYGDVLKGHLFSVVPISVYKLLVQLRPQNGSNIDAEQSIVAPNGMVCKDREDTTYPYIRLLLKFDSAQFLNVISTCIDAPIFTTPERDDGQYRNERLRRLLDILVSIFETSDSSELGANLIPFVLTLLQKNAIQKDFFLFTQLIQQTLKRSNMRASTEIQIVELMRSVEEIDHNQILELAVLRPHIHICSFILSIRREYIRLLKLAINGDMDKMNVFAIIDDLLRNLTNADELNEVKGFVKSIIDKLNEMDSSKTAELVMNYFQEYLEATKIPHSLLSKVFEIGRSKGLQTISFDDELDEKLFGVYFKELIIEESKVDDFHLNKLDEKLTDILKYWLPIGSRNNHCLELVKNHGLLQCTILLLVSKGLKKEAFETLYKIIYNETSLEAISIKVGMMLELVNQCSSDIHCREWLIKIFQFLLSASKDDKFLVDAENENLENGENEALNNNNASIKRPKVYLGLLVTVFTTIVESGFLEGVEQILDDLFTHPPFIHGAHYSLPFFNLINKMLLSCEVEEFLYENAQTYIKQEILNTLTSATNHSRKLFVPDAIRSDVCTHCLQKITKSFLLFNCGHSTHLHCANDKVELRHCNICTDEGGEFESDSLLPVKCIEAQNEWLKVSPYNLSREQPRLQHRHVNIIELIDSQVLRLGPPPPSSTF